MRTTFAIYVRMQTIASFSGLPASLGSDTEQSRKPGHKATVGSLKMEGEHLQGMTICFKTVQ